MKPITLLLSFLIVTLFSCTSGTHKNSNERMITQNELQNETMKEFEFLTCMYQDAYFPTFLVDKCKQILLNLCSKIEAKGPQTLKELYALTHHSTNELNDLQDEFFSNGSEIETGARECLAENFEVISQAYGFDADVEELIATRDW